MTVHARALDEQAFHQAFDAYWEAHGGTESGLRAAICTYLEKAEIERLTRELSEAHEAFKVLLEAAEQMTIDRIDARRKAFEEAGQKAREYAAHYPEASDGRNTFIIFAEWAEGRP